MTIAIPSLRAITCTPQWVRNDLWRRARAVPSLDLQFADRKSLVDGISGQNLITFTRASGGTYVDSAGVLRTAANDEPRFDHNPTTGESLGLLVEESRTNLLVRSGDLNDSSWEKSNATIASNVVLAPDGTLTGDKLAENTNTSAHIALQGSASLSAGATVCASIFLKAGERTFASLGTPSGGVGTGINLLTGELVNVSVAGWGNATTRGAVPVGNGWYRVYFVFTTTGNNSLFDALRVFTNNGSTTLYAGDGTSGIYIWGAQLEAGAFPTSYIPTTTAAVTRAADVASITGSNFSSWYRQDEGSFLGSGRSSDTTNNVPFLMTADDGSLANEIFISRRIGSFLATSGIYASGVSQADMFSSAWATGLEGIIAVGLGTNNCALAFNGQTPVTDASVALPVVNTLRLGRRSSTFNTWNGTIRRLVYWGQRLPNNVLQAITQ